MLQKKTIKDIKDLPGVGIIILYNKDGKVLKAKSYSGFDYYDSGWGKLEECERVALIHALSALLDAEYDTKDLNILDEILEDLAKENKYLDIIPDGY